MVTRIGINGFGRIGRQVLRATLERHPEKLAVVAVNDLTDAKTNAHLFKYDSTYGRYPGTVEVAEDALIIDGKQVKVLAERDPAKIPWGDLGADVVIESTGLFVDRDSAGKHRARLLNRLIEGPATKHPGDDGLWKAHQAEVIAIRKRKREAGCATLLDLRGAVCRAAE